MNALTDQIMDAYDAATEWQCEGDGEQHGGYWALNATLFREKVEAILEPIERVGKAALIFMDDEAGTTTVDGKARWVGCPYAGGALSSAVMRYRKSLEIQYPGAGRGDTDAAQAGAVSSSS